MLFNMLVSDLGKGVNIEKMELVRDDHLGQSVIIDEESAEGSPHSKCPSTKIHY